MLLAVNQGDAAEVIRKFVKDSKVSFPIGMNTRGSEEFKVPEKYGVSGYPTSYVIDSNGKVVWRGVPSDPSAIRMVLDSMGVK